MGCGARFDRLAVDEQVNIHDFVDGCMRKNRPVSRFDLSCLDAKIEKLHQRVASLPTQAAQLVTESVAALIV